MGCIAEALGLMLPGGSLIPSSTSMRRFSARESGKALMQLVKREIRPSEIMTQAALENAVTVLSAIGGSLNAMIHLPALAAELGLPLSWDDISRITSKTPVLTGIVPNGNRTCVDLHQAGGIPALMKELGSLIHGSCMTVTGQTVEENLQTAKVKDADVIRPMSAPLAAADGIQVLYGNLAPEGALVKTSAVPEAQKRFRGVARVFNNEDECYEAFHREEIQSGDVVIIRYEGPKGGPGMKEMHRVTEIIKRIPNTAVVTDGRFSGASGGLSVGYLCPEASDCGPIALVENGDMIEIDLYRGTICVDVSDAILAARKACWKPHVQSGVTGYLARYSKAVRASREGAVLD